MSTTRSLARLGPSPSRFVFAALAILGVLPFLALPACDQKPSAQPASAASAPTQAYTVLGLIEQLPDPAVPANTLRIHHEPIPGFMSQGKVVGMAEMTMPFPTAPGVSLAGLAIGDPVEFIFEVQEKPRMTYQITSIKKLPADTKLNLTNPPKSGG